MGKTGHLAQVKLYITIFFFLYIAVSEQSPCEVREQIANCTFRSLASIPQDLPVNIKGFLLSNNNITGIKEGSFKKYMDLTYLDLSHNKLSKLENYSFSGLDKLKILHLENNVLNLTSAAYPASCFVGLTALQKLFLGENIPLEWFLNPHQSYSYPDVSLSELVSLEELTIDGLPDTVFGLGFRAMGNLQTLNFQTCYLNFIREDMFTNTPHITNLNMQHCHIYDSHNISFTKLTHIDSLNLSYNLELGNDNATHIFFGLQNSPIRVLDLSWINPRFAIDVVPPVDFFKYLFNTTLEQLICDHNQLVLLKPGTLDYFPPSVTYVSLRYNRFTLGQYLFEVNKIKGVKRVDLSDMVLGHFSVEPFDGDLPIYPLFWPRLAIPKQLAEIIFRNCIMHAGIPPVVFMENSLKSLDISQNGISIWKGPVGGLKKLERLDMSTNFCTKVSSYFFESFPLLRFLNVSNNYLGEAARDPSLSGLFDSLSELEVLDMSHNRFRFIHRTLFARTTKLKYLNISNNELFDYNLDTGHIALFLFSLQGNDIRTVLQNSRNALDAMNMKHPLEINLSNNPLLCTCMNLKFLLWIFSTDIQFQSLDTYTCIDEFNDVNFLDESLVMAKKEKCKSYAGLAFGGGCVVIFFLTVGVVGLVYRYRWRIKYLYHVAKDKYNPRTHASQERQFMYDAFISYANEDLDFVDTLMTNLEGQETSLCLHHRDFRLGEPIGSNIVRAVQHSKHTVVILSENFLASDWCRYEFEMARMEAVYASRNVLLVVKIEEVNTAAVPRELLYMMRSESYLEYPTNAEDQAAFWVSLNEAVNLD